MTPARPNTAFDLHLHSLASDGRYPAEEVLRRCAMGGLDVVAITDHDLATELAPGVHRIENRDLTVIAGAEVSGIHAGQEFHLLVYFPGEVPPGFTAFCHQQCQARASRYEQAMSSLGMELEPPDERALRGERALTRLHLAQELVKGGHVANTREAFRKYLGHRLGHVPTVQLTFCDAIAVARSFGGVTSWAHPSPDAVASHGTTFAAAGLQGIEGLRPTLNSRQRHKLKRLAARLSLFITGGSDWHGWKAVSPGLFRVEAHQIGGFLDTLQAA